MGHSRRRSKQRDVRVSESAFLQGSRVNEVKTSPMYPTPQETSLARQEYPMISKE
jgi:hypothetical protein